MDSMPETRALLFRTFHILAQLRANVNTFLQFFAPNLLFASVNRCAAAVKAAWPLRVCTIRRAKRFAGKEKRMVRLRSEVFLLAESAKTAGPFACD